MHILQQLPPSGGKAVARGGSNGAVDLEGLWLLCRTQLGAVEAALVELDGAALRVANVRKRWQGLSGGSPSMIFNYAVRAATSTSFENARRVTQRAGSAFDVSVAGDAGSPAATRASHAEEEQARSIEAVRGGLGPARTRLGLGARRRALLRCERSLASHAGALHDLRVALREIGGEWLELGRWIGGPPLASMPWDVRPGAAQCKALIAACSRTAEQLRETADMLTRLGPFNLYREPAPHDRAFVSRHGARRDARPLLGGSRSVLVEATRDALGSLHTLRGALGRARAPRELSPPNVFERHSLVWVFLSALIVYARAVGLHVHLPALRDEVLRLMVAGAADFRRFFVMHVSEPVRTRRRSGALVEARPAALLSRARRAPRPTSLLSCPPTPAPRCTRSLQSSSTARRTQSTRSRSNRLATRYHVCCRTL